jgi:hypothetical protein
MADEGILVIAGQLVRVQKIRGYTRRWLQRYYTDHLRELTALVGQARDTLSMPPAQ